MASNNIARLGVLLGLDSADFVKGLDQANKKLYDFGAAVSQHGKTALLGAGTAFAAATYKAMEFADSIADVAKANDVTIDSILKLNNALANSGGKAEDAGKLLSGFTNFVDKAAQGSLEAQKSFDKAGISLKDLSDLSTEDLFQKTIKGLADINDPLTRNAKAMDIFGKAAKGVDFVGLADGMSTAKDSTQAQAKAIQDAADAYDMLAQTSRNFMLTLTSEIGPSLKITAVYFQELNKEGNLFKGIFKSAFDTVAYQTASFAHEVQDLVEVFGAWYDVLKAIGSLNFKEVGKIVDSRYAKRASEEAKLEKFRLQLEGGSPLADNELPGAKTSSGSSENDSLLSRYPSAKRIITPGIDKEADAIKKQIQLKQAAIALTQRLTYLDGLRSEIALDISNKDQVANKIKLLALDTAEKLAQINRQEKADLTSEEAKKSEDLRKVISANAQAERNRVLKQTANAADLIFAQKRFELDKDALKAEQDLFDLDQQIKDEAIAISDAREQAWLNFSKQVDESIRLNDLANERLAYEGQLYLLNEQQRTSLLAQYDLEKKILEYRREAEKLGTDPATIEEQVKQLKRVGDESIRINAANKDAQNTFEYGWTKAFNDYMDNATNAANKGADAFNSFTNNMANALDNFVETGKISFNDLAGSIIKDLLKIELKASAMNLWKGLKGNNVGGDVFSFIGSLFGGGSGLSSMPAGVRAAGGDVTATDSYLVGEKGPEMFVPNTGGTIVPTNQIGSMGGTTNVTNYNINAIDTKSFEDRILGSSKAVWAANAYGAKNISVGRGRT